MEKETAGVEVIPSEYILSFEESILSKEEHEGQMYTQSTEIVINLRNKNHISNQTGSHK